MLRLRMVLTPTGDTSDREVAAISTHWPGGEAGPSHVRESDSRDHSRTSARAGHCPDLVMMMTLRLPRELPSEDPSLTGHSDLLTTRDRGDLGSALYCKSCFHCFHCFS